MIWNGCYKVILLRIGDIRIFLVNLYSIYGYRPTTEGSKCIRVGESELSGKDLEHGKETIEREKVLKKLWENWAINYEICV